MRIFFFCNEQEGDHRICASDDLSLLKKYLRVHIENAECILLQLPSMCIYTSECLKFWAFVRIAWHSKRFFFGFSNWKWNSIELQGECLCVGWTEMMEQAGGQRRKGLLARMKSFPCWPHSIHIISTCRDFSLHNSLNWREKTYTPAQRARAKKPNVNQSGLHWWVIMWSYV